MKRVLSKNFFENRNTPILASTLLGKFLVLARSAGGRRGTNQHDTLVAKRSQLHQGHHVDLSYSDVVGMITEVEAYDGPRDMASHAHRGKTARNFPMFRDAGHWYVYFTYGMHWMLNIVTGPENYPAAILIRGVSGCSGPARLTKELGIDKVFNSLPANKKTGLWIEDRGVVIPKSEIKSSPRIGVDYAGSWAKKPYRFYIVSPGLSWKDAATILRSGGVGVILTDTIYSVVGFAMRPETVEKIYQIRKRGPKKPMIVLISSVRDLARFGISPSPKIQKILRAVWPGKVSVILPCRSKKFSYLHRGANSLAFRIPQKKQLLALLRKTGPLVAPSANLEGKPPAATITEAKKYFKNAIDFCIDGGRIKSLPSTLIAIDQNGSITVRRQGAAKLL